VTKLNAKVKVLSIEHQGPPYFERKIEPLAVSRGLFIVKCQTFVKHTQRHEAPADGRLWTSMVE
jgi:hypothetical protein